MKTQSSQPLKLALIGFGNVGRAFADMLARKSDFITENYGVTPVITAVCRTIGAAENPGGLDAANLSPADFDAKIKPLDVITRADYDVMIELTPLNIATGEPAISHIKAALSRGKHVITANKGPLAWAYRELSALAEKHGACFYYEATVMDGVPVFNLEEHCLPGCKITEITGILNTTTNFVLTQLEIGRTLDEAIALGQQAGFVERDPAMDLDGYDAAAKLTVLMNVLMDAKITPDAIDRTGIMNITPADIAAAKDKHKRVKLMCRGRIENGRPVGVVAPEAVDETALYATVADTAAVVTLTTDLMGAVSVVEHPFEPEIDHTAYGVFSDLLRILRK